MNEFDRILNDMFSCGYYNRVDRVIEMKSIIEKVCKQIPADRKIDRIKEVRGFAGVGLKEAKDAVEAYMATEAASFGDILKAAAKPVDVPHVVKIAGNKDFEAKNLDEAYRFKKWALDVGFCGVKIFVMKEII